MHRTHCGGSPHSFRSGLSHWKPEMRQFFLSFVVALHIILLLCIPAKAQDNPLQSIFTAQHDAIVKPSRSSAHGLIAALLKSGSPQARVFLEKWRDREVWVRKSDGAFFLTKPNGCLLYTSPSPRDRQK